MDPIDEKFVDMLQTMGKANGFDDLSAKMFAILYIEPEEIAMEDLARKTGYSLGSISTRLKMLENVGFVYKRRKPKTKKVYISMPKDLIATWKDHFLKAQEYKISLAKRIMPEILKEYRAKAKTDTQKKKLKILEDYSRQINRFDDIWQNI